MTVKAITVTKQMKKSKTIGNWMKIETRALPVCLTVVFPKNWHPKIKFTIEKQTENQLSFLDLLITSNGDNFLTSVYQ